MIRITIVMAAGLALAVTLPAVSAQAQNGTLTRSFVSSTGVDTNACTITAPCATFAQAYTKIGANGIIAALDPGKYGQLTITGPVTVNGNGWAAMTGNGILMQPTSGTLRFVITNTVASNNGFIGIFYLPPNSGSTATADLAMDHVVITNNSSSGISLDSFFASGSTTVAISNSIANYNNVGIGVSNGTALLAASIDNTSMVGNKAYGLDAIGTPRTYLGRSVITDNGIGVENDTSPNSVYSYQNNGINGNGTGTADDVAGMSTSLNSLTLK
jgi:hypothetical protein